VIRLLLVDDNDEVRRTLRLLLADVFPDATVVEAATGGEALARAADGELDAVLLDLSLPDRSGIGVLRELHRSRPELPVVVMSFHPETEYAAVARTAGAAGYISKGSSGEAIGALLSQAFGTSRPASR
jgi:two-component system invasion response regulator UvrY